MLIISKARLAKMIRLSVRTVAATTLVSSFCSMTSFAADSDAQVVKALSYSPRQTNVVYEKVAEKDVASCTGKYETRNGFEGLVIYGTNGQPLRRFADSNGDRQVDQWCYYKDGIEVYRDVDSDFNGAADQYRWLGTGGTRWAIDKNEDGKIDSWKVISAEEVTMEVVESIKTRDDERFKKLLLSDDELKALGLAEEKGDQLSTRLGNARKGFGEFVRTQKMITANTKWAHFAADKPGVVPAGTEGSAHDIVAYENTIAIIENDSESQQLMVGTLVQIGEAWRLADLPRTVTAGAVLSDSGLFFPAAASNRMGAGTSSDAGLSQEVQSLLTELEKIENKLKDGKGNRNQLQDDKSDVLMRLVVANKNTEELELWVKQFTDSTSSAAQTGEYPDGVSKMKLLVAQLANFPKGKDFVPYVEYRLISTEFTVKSNVEKADFAKLQSWYMEKLEEFATNYPDNVDAADAMIQIGLNHELGGNERDAETWYKKVSTKFPKTLQGEKATGAWNRLHLEGRQIGLVGKTLDGKSIDSKTMGRGPILVHYWASWCEPCKQDMTELRKLQAKYARQNLQIVGVNLDTDAKTATDFLSSNKAYPWPHLHEQGGFDSSLAVRLGVLSVPVTILIDADGKVAKRTSHFSKEMENALDDLLDAPASQPSAQPAATPPAPPKVGKQPPPTTENKRPTQPVSK
ncbi:MAG: redoxin family protein, partial [Pirellula sp.]